MSCINLIFTQHEEYGNCSSYQLLKLIEYIKPEIIFEELSQINYDRSYKDETLITLETRAIKKYLTINLIKHIPVDTFPRGRDHDEKIDRLYSRLKNGITQDAFEFKRLISQHHEICGKYGFEFLNSSANEYYFRKLEIIKLKILNHLKDENLFQIHKDEIKMISDRESRILENIYAFYQEGHFNKALMFIGSGHRKTIIPLINRFNEKSEIKLEWKIFPN